jgi:hypothetical protein
MLLLIGADSFSISNCTFVWKSQGIYSVWKTATLCEAKLFVNEFMVLIDNKAHEKYSYFVLCKCLLHWVIVRAL